MLFWDVYKNAKLALLTLIWISVAILITLIEGSLLRYEIPAALVTALLCGNTAHLDR